METKKTLQEMREFVKSGNAKVLTLETATWDSEKWIYTNVKDAEIVAFTETDPKSIAVSL